MPKDTIGFDFTEIPLEEAQSVVTAGDGKYSDLVIMLSKKLPELEMNNMNIPPKDRKGFAFGLPSGKELDEKERRGLCHTVNLRMNRQGVGWRVTYSGNKKLFICIPRKSKIKSVKDDSYVPKSKWNGKEDEVKIMDLRDKGMSVPKISRTTGIDLQRVSYICYKKYAKGAKVPLPTAIKPKSTIDVNEFIETVKKTFKIDTLKGRNTRTFRTAACIVGKRLGLGSKELAPFMGITWKGVNYNGRQRETHDATKLRMALLNNGGKS